MSPDADEAPRSAKALLLEDFDKACILDRVCHCFPSKAFCAHCCSFHHPQPHRVNGEASTVTAEGQGVLKSRNGRVLVRHELRGTRCVGLCAICSQEVPEEYNRHKCFMDYHIPTLKEMTSKDLADNHPMEGYRPDMFCVDCVSNFSSVLCEHHTGHRILEFMIHGAYNCIVLPVNADSEYSLAFDRIMRRPWTRGRQLVAIRWLGKSRCGKCRLSLQKDSASSCSISCFSVIDRA